MIFFLAFSVIYVGFLCWCRWHWGHISQVNTDTPPVQFSVIIPVRNEEKNIQSLLEDLKNQDYPLDLFEVLVVNDQSQDDTGPIVSQFIDDHHLDWKLLTVDGKTHGGKKRAISLGVQHARFEHILTSDGDCHVNRRWLKSFSDAYQVNDMMMITGPVQMKGDSLFTRLQAAEFAGLIGIGAATLHSANPTMCNGANLSYKREVFFEVGGYSGNESIPSGDDEFLLQKIFNRYPEKVRFLKNSDAIVSTGAKETLTELSNQRIRWSSKWRFHKSWFIKLMALMLFANYLSMFVALLEVTQSSQWIIWSVIMLTRWLGLLYFSYPVIQFFRIRGVVWLSFLIEIIYPFFVIFLGIASIFGKYSWKGRYYS